jgi:hypothetical protein
MTGPRDGGRQTMSLARSRPDLAGHWHATRPLVVLRPASGQKSGINCYRFTAILLPDLHKESALARRG